MTTKANSAAGFRHFKKLITIAWALACSVSLASAASAQETFPARTLRIVVPTAAGGGSDMTARFFSEQLSKALGQSVIVENRPGANGAIAAMAVKNAPADGHTIFLGTNTHMAVNPVLMKGVPYDAQNDFKPISGLSRQMMVLVTGANSPLKSVADITQGARQAGKSLNVGGYTGGFELSAAWFANVTQTQQVYVSYKGIGDIVVGLMGDQLDWAISDPLATLAQIKAGKLRALAVTGDTRHPDLPDVPTVKESGFPSFVNYSWGGMYVRAETPAPVTDKLAQTMGKLLSTPAAIAFVQKFGSDPLTLSPAEMRKFQISEIERFRKVASDAGIQPR
ncbi:MAG: tripartite tricarboxylate transporter substrate binding protein [Comamonadaceae bacterium]|nr:tripartite tricarboxylate transporter substrate binding protein [Comamonadaceae bacterium]